MTMTIRILTSDGQLVSEIPCSLTPGSPLPGFRVDEDGRLWFGQLSSMVSRPFRVEFALTRARTESAILRSSNEDKNEPGT